MQFREKETEMSSIYTKDYPGGVCRSCFSTFQRVANKEGNLHAGEYVHVLKDGKKFHVACGERWTAPLTADVDHYSYGAGTAKKPHHL